MAYRPFNATLDPAIYDPLFSQTILPSTSSLPWYYSTKSQLLPFISDLNLSLISPVIAYWVYSLFFHFLDTCGDRWGFVKVRLDRWRLHESEEVKQRNLVSRTAVVVAVLFQQVVQTLMGYYFLEAEVADGGLNVGMRGVEESRKWFEKWSPVLVQSVLLWMGEPYSAQGLLQRWGSSMLYVLYWWFIPTVQMLWAFFVLDSWQYWFHRYFHTNKFLYRHFHSWHHRLYVPYAFGALYNHPLEGLLFDISGPLLSQSLAFLSTRQAVFMFTFASLKTVDDHCGYKIPFDPFQWIFANNADFHDIHHQSWGIKKNFAQPFFVHWDWIMGTRLTRDDVKKMKEKNASKAKDRASTRASASATTPTSKINGVANGNGTHATKTNGSANGANGYSTSVQASTTEPDLVDRSSTAAAATKEEL